MKKQSNDIIDDLVKLVDQTSEGVSQTIDESLRKNGYDNIGDFVSEGVNSVFSNRKGEKPYSTHSFVDFDSRYTYLIEALSHIEYERKYRGVYKEGHEQIIQLFLERLYRHDVDFLTIEKDIKSEIRNLKSQVKSVKNKFKEGQLDAFNLILKELRYSKKKLMRKVEMELIKK